MSCTQVRFFSDSNESVIVQTNKQAALLRALWAWLRLEMPTICVRVTRLKLEGSFTIFWHFVIVYFPALHHCVQWQHKNTVLSWNQPLCSRQAAGPDRPSHGWSRSICSLYINTSSLSLLSHFLATDWKTPSSSTSRRLRGADVTVRCEMRSKYGRHLRGVLDLKNHSIRQTEVKERDRNTDRQTHRWTHTHTQTDTQTDTDRQTDRQAGRQTDRCSTI